VKPKSRLDTAEKIKVPCPHRDSKPGSPARSPLLYRRSCPFRLDCYMYIFIIIRKRTFLRSRTLQGNQYITAHVNMTISKVFYAFVKLIRVLVFSISIYLPRIIVIGVHTNKCDAPF
jgi:hypothetical protein